MVSESLYNNLLTRKQISYFKYFYYEYFGDNVMVITGH